MNKLIYNSQLLISEKLAHSVRILGVMLCILVASMAHGQVDCNITMACNDGIQVSLDDNCVALISPDMILEDPEYDDAAYTVTVMNLAGNVIPNATVTYAHVNQTLSVNVTLTGCPASCWGTITVEDKLPPVFSSCLDYEVECDDNFLPGGGIIPYPTVVDACAPVNNLVYFDEIVSNACADDFVKTITRTWTAKDQQGNSATCVQTIYVNKASIDDIVWPPNYDNIDQPAFSCAVNIETLPNGAPTPAVTGMPSGATCPNIQTYYSDIVFDICGASIKVLRQWVVVDWCTGEEATWNQIIKILDTKGPVCTSNPDFMNEIFTDEGSCTGTFVVPPPIVIFECSDYSYIVGYKLKDENGDPFENPVYDNVTYNAATGLFTISDLPQDTSWIVYTLTDACGNKTQCFTEVFVEDGEAPIPVCEGYTVVGLEDAGWADIYAFSIDDGSYDNCGIEKYEVKRLTTNCGIFSDLQFGPTVNFCCNDVSQGYISVVMRVTDLAGNYNDCVVNVKVQDKINPVITCPKDISIQCTQDYTNLSITGTATATDNCSVIVTYTDQINLNDCGLGTVTRNWKATDPQGRTATCTQKITLRDTNPFDGGDIQWPGDKEVNGCDASTASPEDLNSFPILSNTDCANIAISYDDLVIYNTPDYCIKILRRWKIADWCNYNPQDPQFYEYVQKIGIMNSSAPAFTSCQSQTFETNDGDCEEQVTVSVLASDDCTIEPLLKYSYVIDVDNNGTLDYNGVGKSFTRILPSGVHKVIWTVQDGCYNISTCTQLITIIDNKPPTPICLGTVTWVLGEDGETTVWASDFDLKSFDECDEDDQLVFSFNASGTQQSLNFDCTDIPNGIQEEIELSMYVIDTDGNSEFCDVILILQDSQGSNACQDQEGGKATIAGSILNDKNEGLLEIEVQLMHMEDQEAEMEMTEEAGSYMFEDVDYYGGYAVEPYKNDDASNGVSTLDLVMIQRHILGLAILDSPYKLIAADVNGNEKLTSSDLLLIRKIILGVESDFGDNTSWRFIPTTHEIEDPTDPFGFPEKVVISELYASNMNIDFTAIKTGDINGNATINFKKGETSETRSPGKNWSILNQSFEAGEAVEVPVYANEVSELVGAQFTLEVGDNLVFEAIKGNKLEFAADNTKIDGNMVSVSWNSIESLSLSSDEVLFTIYLRAKQAGELKDMIAISSEVIAAESYDNGLNVNNLGLEVQNRDGIVFLPNALHQNVPNPFKGMTTIAFDLEEEGMATLAVYDISGKELYRISNEFNRGKNGITLDLESLGVNSGILYYTLKAGSFTATKKMIALR